MMNTAGSVYKPVVTQVVTQVATRQVLEVGKPLRYNSTSRLAQDRPWQCMALNGRLTQQAGPVTQSVRVLS